jgi:hypothetical protein
LAFFHRHEDNTTVVQKKKVKLVCLSRPTFYRTKVIKYKGKLINQVALIYEYKELPFFNWIMQIKIENQ